MLILRRQLGLAGPFHKMAKVDSGLLTCNNAFSAFFGMKACATGYELAGWTATEESISGSGGGDVVQIQLMKEQKMTLMKDGKYLKGYQTGELKFDGTEIEKDTLWEY